jgi:fumarate hydratase class II
MPPELIWALALVKQACAEVNGELGELTPEMAHAIAAAAQEVLDGVHEGQFPLRVWQSGSGTQTNMNMNEVLAHRASALLSGDVHPNDHVNAGQSSNDVIPTAMHVACAVSTAQRLVPALNALRGEFATKAHFYKDLIKIGRTHLQDAVPLTLGQELSGYEAQLALAIDAVERALQPVFALAIGGTAVGTGLNAPEHFGERVAQRLADGVGLPFTVVANRFSGLAAHDAIVGLHAALKCAAVALMKIANDIRWLASGPRCGLGELILPANEPGSSIMPGKVNPSQCEAMMMVCCKVMGNDASVSMAGACGNLELNTFKPLIAHDTLQSIRLLADACRSFHEHCIQGLSANTARIDALRESSLMLVTALSPHIGYDEAARIAKHAHAQNLSLRESALALGYEAALFDQWVRPEQMV